MQRESKPIFKYILRKDQVVDLMNIIVGDVLHYLLIGKKGSLPSQPKVFSTLQDIFRNNQQLKKCYYFPMISV